jgi:hypothetical protein
MRAPVFIKYSRNILPCHSGNKFYYMPDSYSGRISTIIQTGPPGAGEFQTGARIK